MGENILIAILTWIYQVNLLTNWSTEGMPLFFIQLVPTDIEGKCTYISHRIFSCGIRSELVLMNSAKVLNHWICAAGMFCFHCCCSFLHWERLKLTNGWPALYGMVYCIMNDFHISCLRDGTKMVVSSPV